MGRSPPSKSSRCSWLVLVAVAGCGGGTLTFDKQVIDRAYRAEGVAMADIDLDGHVDLATDQRWYAGPGFTVAHDIRPPETYDPATQYGHGFAVHPADLDGDGRPDLVVAPFPGDEMVWVRNPGADEPWARFVIAPAGVAGLETPIFVDLFGTGRPVLLMTDAAAGLLAWYEPPADPRQPWLRHPISAAGYAGAGLFVHGIGAGDVDGDGKTDVLTGYGWFQQVDPQTWIEHPVAFGPNRCAQLQVLDVDGDGRADVLCSAPHDYGFSWFRQQADGTFTAHPIDTTLSQMHALLAEDLDGDGVPELVSGKRFWAHGPSEDPGASDPAVLAVYRLHDLQRIDLDDDSGIGTSFAIGDADGDGRKDLAVSNKKGLFLFVAR